MDVPDKFTVKGKSYPTNPGLMDETEEAFLPNEDRAQVQALRQTLQKARSNPSGYSSNIDTSG